MALQIIEVPPPEYHDFIKYNHYQHEFEMVARNSKIKIMYKWVQENGNTCLGFLYQNLFHIYEIPNRFTCIEDWLQAKKEGFTNCTYEQWQQLKQLGYRTREEMDGDRGEYSIEQWIDIRFKGYKNCEEFDMEKGTRITDNKDLEIRGNGTYQFNTAIIDGSNISWGDYEESPKFIFIFSVYEKLKELGVKPYVVVSAALRHHIDEPSKLVEFLKQDDVCEAPADRPDDFFVIQLALRRNAFIVSNDRFKDWKRANPKLADEIDRRRVALTFIEDDPQFDHNLYKLIKRPAKYL